MLYAKYAKGYFLTLDNHKMMVKMCVVKKGRKKYGKLLDIRGNFITFVVFYGDANSCPIATEQTF